ncbi:AAA family ATPase [Streptomyces sp. NPDC051776]|uniref:helix-turn-helix transcriptional regulator n=1 Tax=Streptomyces sp. NPDC051776 TaxID=3155414 RepID=UPI0034433952
MTRPEESTPVRNDLVGRDLDVMLIDRDAELSRATVALRRAQAGRGAFVLVSGPLGIGKSALLDEIGERGAQVDATVLKAGAAPMERDFSYGVARQLLEPALRRADEDVLASWTEGAAQYAIAALSDGAFGACQCRPADEGEGSGAATQRGLTTLAENIARDRTLLVLVDDLQWTDEATLHWLHHLTQQIQTARILLVCTLRDGCLLAGQESVRELVERATHTLRPQPFRLRGSRAVVRLNSREPADEEFVAACHTAAGGNPALLTSLLEESATHGFTPVARNAATLAELRPASMRQRILQCLEAQSPRVLRLARSMAVLGEGADLGLLGRLSALDPACRDDSLRVLVRLGLVKTSEDVQFVHPVVRDAALEGMSTADRTSTHARAAELLHQAGRPVEQVADQLMKINAPQDSWARKVLRAASESALHRGEAELSARYLRCALLDSFPHGSDRGRLLVELATAERSFAPLAAVRHMAQAMPLLDSALDRADGITRLAPIVLASSLLPVQDVLRQIAGELGDEQRLRGRERELALRLEARLRHTCSSNPVQLSDAVVRLKMLGPDPSTETAAERELLAMLLAAATCANALPAAEVAELAERIMKREPPHPSHVHTAVPMVIASMVAADSADSLVLWLETARAEAARGENRVEQALIRSEQALAALANGRLNEARPYAVEAFELAGTEHDGVGVVAAVSLALVAIESRDVGLARQLLGGRYRATNESYLWALLTMLSGTVALTEGDTRGALDHFYDAGHRMEQYSWRNPALLPWASHAAVVHHHLGEHERAAALSQQEVELAQLWGAPSALGRALIAQGRVTEGAPGLAMLRDAVNVLEGSPNHFELSRALLALGDRLGLDSPEGEAALRQAYAMAVACGAARVADQAASRLGNAVPSSPAPARGRLTPAELKVAKLAAGGLSNQAIADDFGISCRAVEKHLTNCYRKLSITGRSVLRTALHRLESESG